MKSLLDLKILITRPAHQAHELAIKIRLSNGIAICFPSLEIAPTPIKPLTLALKKLPTYDFVLFISPNAVFKTAYPIHKLWPDWPKHVKTVATGPGTVLALKQHKLPTDYYPEKDFSGTGLLTLPALQDLRQKKILILKGQGGRLYLAKELKSRGAHVNRLNVYKRQLPDPAKNNIPDKNAVDVIICTSNSGLKNLVHLLYPIWQDILFEKQLLVISPRIADSAKKLGFVKSPLISDNASNTAILQTLFSWREQSTWNHSRLPRSQKKPS
ncbi:MAG: uroporphyrinogen-III synthase [Candidatus Aquirickettsiella gammari]|jgi:uroporphyrinogen-III synthase|uniref:Uroporphyrinogen-III synthase n=1 Tax=Candidatus Aquirickettsiella gammari TaxID=2016198 RepID=A0A370CJQ3_9COXI|nr:MAG: uroporphyrinogen-III synthase [Candidatus Aquirickettsiella gammari]